MIDERWRGRHQFYIHPTSDEARRELVEYLEQKGYACSEYPDREEVLSSFLPVVAETNDRTIRTTGNVTVAACAATCNLIMSEDEFYQVFEELGDDLG